MSTKRTHSVKVEAAVAAAAAAAAAAAFGATVPELSVLEATQAALPRKKRAVASPKVDGATPATNVVCRCERVTEAEIVDALHRCLPAASTQAVRKRTRAGMGYCQGEFCEARVAAIIARECGGAPGDVPRRPWPASSIRPRRWMGEADIEDWLACRGGKP